MQWPGRRTHEDGEVRGSADGRPRWRRPFRNVSLATRLALVALVVTLLSLVVTATVGLARGNELANDLTEDRVVAIAASQADAVELYFSGIQSELDALASSPGTRLAIEELGDAYAELASEPIDSRLDADLTEYYTAEVIPALESVRGSDLGPSLLAPQGAAGIYLQSHYTVPQVDDDGDPVDPVLVLDPGDGSAYSEAHPPVHHAFSEIGLRSGFDDLLLVDARQDVIVYSVSKRTDFATSLDLGPLSGSSLARLIDSIAIDPGAVVAPVADFAAYPPADDRPTAFVASPVMGDDGALVGHAVAVLGIDPLDDVLSVDGSWRGFPGSGSAYLAGSDGTMRSTARAYQESPSAYLDAASDPGPGSLSDVQRRRIAATDTTALVQTVNRNTLELAEQGIGTVEAPDFRGVDVLSAYRPVAVEGVDWAILADVPTDDLDGPIERYARSMLLAVSLFVVMVTFVSVAWSTRLMAPIRAIATRLRQVRADPMGASGAADRDGPAEPALTEGSPAEYEELAVNIDQMLERLQVRQGAVAARASERASLLHQFLPAGIARRTEEGESDLIDHIRNASVVVLRIDGLGHVEPESHPRVRSMLADIVDETDALAADFGLDRVKTTGASYVAVCGVSRPFLDHAPRAAAFALAARDLVDELSDGQLSVRGAVDDGVAAVGLAARAGLLYDAWGPAVESAEELARRSPAGAITVSPQVRRQLPSEFVIANADAAGDEPAVITGRVADGATP